MASLHDDGYQFIGDTAINKLTISEVRVLFEGKVQNQKEQKQKRRAQNNNPNKDLSKARMNIEKSRDSNDQQMVERMAGN